MNVHFSSASDDWATPQYLFDELNAIHHFELDVCASDANAKCLNYFDKEIDGLKQDWRGSVWCNPPYGRQISKWIEKAYNSAGNGTKVVCLIPARTDTSWWHDYVIKGKVTFIRGRLKFGNAKNPAPFPSAIVVFE